MDLPRKQKLKKKGGKKGVMGWLDLAALRCPAQSDWEDEQPSQSKRDTCTSFCLLWKALSTFIPSSCFYHSFTLLSIFTCNLVEIAYWFGFESMGMDCSGAPYSGFHYHFAFHQGSHPFQTFLVWCWWGGNPSLMPGTCFAWTNLSQWGKKAACLRQEESR